MFLLYVYVQHTLCVWIEPLPRKGVILIHPHFADMANFLSQVQGFSKDSLKKVETQITSPDGKKVKHTVLLSVPEN